MCRLLDDVSPILCQNLYHKYAFYFSFTSYKIENDNGNVADGGVYVPPKWVVRCEGIPRNSWMTKCVALQNDARVIVGKGICHNVDLDLIVDNDNQPLGDDRVVVHQKHRQLDVHKQIHRDANRRDMITLEGMEVCPKICTTIMGVHRSSFY